MENSKMQKKICIEVVIWNIEIHWFQQEMLMLKAVRHFDNLPTSKLTSVVLDSEFWKQ